MIYSTVVNRNLPGQTKYNRKKLWDSRLLERCYWEVKSSRRWSCVLGRMTPLLSGARCIFHLQGYAIKNFWVPVYLEYESPVWLRNVGHHRGTESTQNLCQNSRSQGRCLSSGLPRIWSRVLTNRLRLSVACLHCANLFASTSQNYIPAVISVGLTSASEERCFERPTRPIFLTCRPHRHIILSW